MKLPSPWPLISTLRFLHSTLNFFFFSMYQSYYNVLLYIIQYLFRMEAHTKPATKAIPIHLLDSSWELTSWSWSWNARVRGLRVLPFSIPRHIGRCTPSSGGIFGLLYCLLCQLPLSMKQVHSINFLFTVVAALEHNSAKSMMWWNGQIFAIWKVSGVGIRLRPC